MSQDDRFFQENNAADDDADRTVFISRPASNRQRSRAGAPLGQPAFSQKNAAPPPIQQMRSPAVVSLHSDVNVIVSAATPLLTLGINARSMSHHPDPKALYQQIAEDLKAIDLQLKNQGLPKESIITARYIICAYIDEMVMSTPWGGQSLWATRNLLMTFHKNNQGGTQFFDIINLLTQSPAMNLDLIELCYMILQLGFQGRYRISDTGSIELSGIQDNLYRIISTHRPAAPKQLSNHWRGAVNEEKTSLSGNKRLLIAVGTSLLIAVLSYTGFVITLGQQSDPVAIKTASVSSNLQPIVRNNRPIKRTTHLSYIRNQLKHDINQQNLSVEDISGGVRIIVFGSDLFKPSSAQLTQQKEITIANIIATLKNTPGFIQVTGHTDDIPIRTLQFPSNWELSSKRANSIVKMIQTHLPEREIVGEGVADSSPIVPNDSNENRAINRRIEINLYTI
ncbi:MAG: type VI secretion system protein ImpK [Oleispira sp.]|jgi:type VI secretion system protein ImpK|tara:strand:+ start:3527 stop:4882 length:1356 start_codon:yes stop_codon:yes gene_type:complete